MSLTARSYLFAGLIVVLAVLGQWTTAIAPDLWRYPTALLLFALLIEGVRARHVPLTIEQSAPAHMALGAVETLQLRLNNASADALHVHTQARLPSTLAADERLERWTIPAHSSVSRSYSVVPVELGSTDFGRLYARVRGHLGLAWWKRRTCAAPRIEVLPRSLRHREWVQGHVARGERYVGKGASSGDDLLSLRDYQYGDPLHSVDWKATARRGHAMVRVYARQQQLDMMLVIDNGRTSRMQAGVLSRLHHAINVAARLAQLAASAGDRVGLMYLDGERLVTIPPGQGAQCLATLRQALAGMRSQNADFDPLIAALEVRKRLPQRSLVVMLCEIEQKQAARQLAKACSVLTPKHLPLVASLIDSAVQALREKPVRDWFDPYLRYAAIEYSRSQANTALQLQRLGTAVVMAPPDALDEALLSRYRTLRSRQRV